MGITMNILKTAELYTQNKIISLSGIKNRVDTAEEKDQ